MSCQRHVACALDSPLIVLFQEQRSYKADDGIVIGDDARNVSASLDLDVQPPDEPVADNGSLQHKFVDVHRAQGSAIASEAIRRIAQIYAVETEARGSPPDRRVEIRQAKAPPPSFTP